MTDTAVSMPDAGAIAAMTPVEADAKLTELGGNEAWRGRFLKGSGPEGKAFAALMERRGADFRLDTIVSGTAPLPDVDTHVGTELTVHNQMRAAEGLREQGIPDEAIKMALKGDAVSKEEFDAAAKVKADLLGNKEFIAKWLAGDREAVRQMTLLHIIGVAGFKKAAA